MPANVSGKYSDRRSSSRSPIRKREASPAKRSQTKERSTATPVKKSWKSAALRVQNPAASGRDGAAPPRAGTVVRSVNHLTADVPARPTGWPYKDPYDFMTGKRADDGVPAHCHRVHDKVYDLGRFSHPGGALWLDLTRGTDITELFESHHLDYTRAVAVLAKYEVRELTGTLGPRNSPFTFRPGDFYHSLRQKVWERHRATAALGPAPLTQVFADSMALLSAGLTCLAGMQATDCWLGGARSALLIGLLNGLFIGIGHNCMHQQTNFRRFYLDISGFSSGEFRMHHALSHHPYTNTTLDAEINSLLPEVSFFPKKKSLGDSVRAGVTLALACTLAVPLKQCVRVGRMRAGSWPAAPEDWLGQLMPLLQLLLLADCARGVSWAGLGRGAALLLLMQAATSTLFLWGNFLNGPHFNDECWHQGDTLDSTDWGILQLQTSVERSELPSVANTTPVNLLNVATFGLHQLHHLFPTIDAVYLTELAPLFEEHCREHGVRFRTMTNAELAAGLWRCIIGGYEQPSTRTRNGITGVRAVNCPAADAAAPASDACRTPAGYGAEIDSPRACDKATAKKRAGSRPRSGSGNRSGRDRGAPRR